LTASSVVRIDPCTHHGWAELVAASGTLFNSGPWLRAVRDAFGVQPHAYVLEDEDKCVAGLTVGYVDDAVGERLSTYPFSDYCDPIGVTEADLWHRLSATVMESGLPYGLRARAHPVVDADHRLRHGSVFKWHDVDLRGDEEELWARLASPARQNIRRAQRSNVAVELGSDRAAVETMHRLHGQLRRAKYNMLAQPPEYFDALVEHFAPDDLLVVTAIHEAQPVASILLLRWAERAYYKFNASTPAAAPVRANDLIMWESMRAVRSHWGSSALDLGLSDIDQPGLLRYKEKYASASGEIVAHQLSTPPLDARGAAVRSLVHEITSVLVASEATDDDLMAASSTLYRFFC
jgi:hypothetical protein